MEQIIIFSCSRAERNVFAVLCRNEQQSVLVSVPSRGHGTVLFCHKSNSVLHFAIHEHENEQSKLYTNTFIVHSETIASLASNESSNFKHFAWAVCTRYTYTTQQIFVICSGVFGVFICIRRSRNFLALTGSMGQQIHDRRSKNEQTD